MKSLNDVVLEATQKDFTGKQAETHVENISNLLQDPRLMKYFKEFDEYGSVSNRNLSGLLKSVIEEFDKFYKEYNKEVY